MICVTVETVASGARKMSARTTQKSKTFLLDVPGREDCFLSAMRRVALRPVQDLAAAFVTIENCAAVKYVAY